MLLIDLENGKLFLDEEIKQRIISQRQYQTFVKENIVPLERINENSIQVMEILERELFCTDRQFLGIQMRIWIK